MFTIDPDALKELVANFYMQMIRDAHGDVGISVMKSLMQDIRAIYQYIEPEIHQGPIIIFRSLEDRVCATLNDEPIEIISLERLAQETRGSFVIQVLGNNRLLLWKDVSPDVYGLSQEAVVYQYHQRVESFIAKNSIRPIPKIYRGVASMFSIPTFSDLESALEHYKMKMARYSSCKILSQVWYDSDRLFFKNAQEYIMRDSLTQFLKSSLRGDVEVRPEQIVDESHPVDIKVTWMFSNRLALIEIKWLGTPKYDDGHLGKAYTDFRAREGAQQLADYLDENQKQAPTHVTKGYLVLIDGRRYGLNETSTSITKQRGLYYRDKEIEFDPKFHEIRDDFEVPIRMFVEPVCQG